MAAIFTELSRSAEKSIRLLRRRASLTVCTGKSNG
jgi:hypothetical protein